MSHRKNSVLTYSIIIMLAHIIPINLFSESPADLIRGVKRKVSKVAEKATDVVDDIGNTIEDNAKKAINKAKAAAKKIDPKFDELGDDAKEALDKMGIKSASDLIIKSFGNMSEKAAKKVASKLIDLSLFVSNDFIRFVAPYEKVLEEILRPLPAVPTGIPIPLPPGSPPGLQIAIDTIIGYIPCFVIGRIYSESLACLRAFHSLTKNKYFTEGDKRLFFAQKKEADKKYLASEIIKPEVVTKKLENVAKTLRKPLEHLMKLLRKVGPEFFNQLEALNSQVEPIPLVTIIPVAGPIYNGTVFCFKLNNQKAQMDSLLWRFKNNFQPAPKKVYVPLEKLRKSILMGPLLKIVEKNPVKNIKAVRAMNEFIVNHLEGIPWWTHGYIILFLKILSTVKEGILNPAIQAVAGTAASVVTMGGATPFAPQIGKVVSEAINADFVFNFVDTLFVWSFTRYLDNRLNRLEGLMKQAQADGLVIDGSLFESEYKKILSGEEASYPLPDSPETVPAAAKTPLQETAPKQEALEATTPPKPAEKKPQIKSEKSAEQAPDQPTPSVEKPKEITAKVEKNVVLENSSTAITGVETTKIAQEKSTDQIPLETQSPLTIPEKTSSVSEQKNKSEKRTIKKSRKKQKRKRRQKRKRKQARKRLAKAAAKAYKKKKLASQKTEALQ